jgi:osmotically-inducible protein OsmY
MRKILTILYLSVTGLALSGCSSTNTKESTGQYIDNTVITTKVKAALFDAKDINASHITVTSYKNTVQLSGFVNSPQQVTHAGQIASHIEGVDKVENDLLVK